MPDYSPILDFWFEDAGEASGGANRRWFGGGKQTDAAIRERFGDAIVTAMNGGLEAWADHAHGRLALILLLDQFPRNIYRGTAQAYAGDARAAHLARTGLDAGMDRELGLFERAFFLMPLEHSESPADQKASVDGFEALAADAPAGLQEAAETFAGYARDHRDIIDRFGRFPHRNAVLERVSTDAERAYLHDAPRYGQ